MLRYNLLLLLLLIYFPSNYVEFGLLSNPTIKFPAKTTQTLLNINNWSGWIAWDGRSGYGPHQSRAVIYPRGTATVIYTDGCIWGGIIGDSLTKPLRAGGQYYSIGTQPGRIISHSVAQNLADPEVQIYRIRSDYLAVADPELRQDAAEFNGIDPAQVTQDMIDTVRAQYVRAWNHWPADYGAPYYDHNSNGVWDPGLDEPGLLNADQVIWFVCNDLDPAKTYNMCGSPPFGIELQVTMWAYKSDSGPGQAAFRRHRLINKSGYQIDSMYIGQWSDPDVGDYTNDVVGCDSILQIGYAYNGEPTDNLFDPFGLPPPSIGYAILQGPVVPSPGDTAIFDFKKKANFRNLPMTSFGYFPTGNSEWDDPDMQSYDGTLQWYNLLRGFITTRDVLNPTSFTHRNSGVPTKFPVNGDPVSGIGDIDGQGSNFFYGARRMAICSGPFTMMDGDTQEVVLAIVGGLGIDYINSVEVMKTNVEEVQDQYINSLKNTRLIYNFRLLQNYPNPFNSTTTIRFSLEIPDQTEIEIFNSLGQKISTLLQQQLPAGRHEVIWDAQNEAGIKLGSGIYFYRITAGDYVQTRKMILLK